MRSTSRTEPSSAAPAQSQPEDGGADGRRRFSWLNRITVTALIAVVALITGGVNLVYQLWPSLQSDPGLQHSARIAVLAMDKNVTYGAYRLRPGATANPKPEPANSTDGNIFYIQMEMEGFKGSHAKLRWFTYDANNGDRLKFPFSSGHNFKGKAPTHKSISEEWVQLPKPAPHLKTYKIRFELYDSGNVLLSFADTQTFTTGISLPNSSSP
jgi:hypothetical protein